MSASPFDDEQEVLGSFRLEALVEKGGMGEIWRARDEVSGQQVAVKRLKFGRQLGADRVRLMREAQALDRIKHPNVVRYLGAGLDDLGDPYFAMEWLDGESLEQRQNRAPLDLAQIEDLALQVLGGLAACHELGIVHRDIKPGNLFLVGAAALQVKLVDFGVAYFGEQMTRLTRTRELVGTLHYMSPEQVTTEGPVDLRTDLYSLGVVLYQLVTGSVPYGGTNAMTVLFKITSEPLVRPGWLRRGMPPVLEQVIMRAMERDLERRYQTAEEMLAGLNQE